MLSESPAFRKLSPALSLALEEAAAQAKAGGQDGVGESHVFCGILDTEEPDGPGHRVLSILNLDWKGMRETLVRMMGLPCGREIPSVLTMFPSGVRMMEWADDIRSRRGDSTLDAGHVMEALLSDPKTDVTRAVVFHLRSQPAVGAEQPEWLEGLCIALESLGQAWSIPQAGIAQVLQAVQPSLLPWNPREALQGITISGWMHRLEGSVFDIGTEFLLWLRPAKPVQSWHRWFYRRFLEKQSAVLRTVSGARSIMLGDLYEHWPKTEQDLAGRLNREYFAAHRAAGMMRPLVQEDRDFCEKLHLQLITGGQVPGGFEAEFLNWLDQMPDGRFAMDLDGELVGCCGLNPASQQTGCSWLETAPDGEGEGAFAMLTFGLIHPESQRKGLGATQIAARLVLAHRMGKRVARVSATDQSVGWLERLGFRFWHVDASDYRAVGYLGSLRLTPEDTAFLEEWLHWDHLDRLAAAARVEQSAADPL